MKVTCQVSLGELIDKLSILKVKEMNISDSTKLQFVCHEIKVLEQTIGGLSLSGIEDHLRGLIEINSRLWVIEDDIRDKEQDGNFDQGFIELARSVYRINDMRFDLKSRINEVYGSEIREVKSYQKYQ